jgi:hypothetical protein
MEILPQLSHLHIFHPNKKEDRGLWALSKPEAQPEPPGLEVVKERIGRRHGMMDLLDVFVEADRLVDFTRYLTHLGTKQVHSREQL